MTSATDKTGCLSHRPNTHFFVMFEDFLDVAKVSEHQYKLAAFWRVMETKTNDRLSYNEKVIEDAKKQGLPEPETNLWIEIPYSEFVKRACGVFKASSFQVAAAESERLGFSESRIRKRPRNPLDSDSPLEEYKEYRFNTEGMQSVLNGGEYPTPIEINSPLLNSIATRKKKRAVENNTTPIDFNSTPIKNNKGRRKTPIKNNSTPLLKSIGNNISPVSSSEYEKDEENTYPRDSQTLDDSGATAPTHAPSTHAHSNSHQVENKPEKPGPGTLQDTSHQVEQDSPDRDRNEKGHTHAHASSNNAHRPAPAHAAGSRVAQDVPAALTGAGSVAGENDTQSQLPTTDVDNPAQGRGKVESDKPAGKGKGRATTASSKQTTPEFTSEGQKVWDAWCSLFKSPPPAAEKTIACANDLYARLVPWCQELKIPCKTLLKDIKGWLYATDPDWYRPKGVSLCDISAKFERWQSAKEHELATLARSTASNAATAPTKSGLPRWVTPDVAFARAASGS